MFTQQSRLAVQILCCSTSVALISTDLGHVPTAISLPHGLINERNLSDYEDGTVFVVYCAGPHCNGADRAASRVTRLGRPVKKMIGGIEGWKDEGLELVVDDE